MVGSSGHASTVLEAIEVCGAYNVIGLLDSFEPRGIAKHGYQVLGTPDEAAAIAKLHGCRSFFVSIGDNWQRWRMTDALKTAVPDGEFPFISYPNVYIARTARIGGGTILMPFVAVMSNVQIGEGCIVNTGSAVNHDCRLADFSSISGGVHLGGGVSIGPRSSIGLGAVVREKTVIGTDSVIGAGSAVFRDVPDRVVVLGSPARTVKTREPHESYMV